jgi:hypothetical protein
MINEILVFIFGKPTTGETLSEPRFNTYIPNDMPDSFFTWAADLKVGSMLDKRTNHFSY